MDNNSGNKITVWGSRTVNIGDYEKDELGVSISMDVATMFNDDKTVTVTRTASRETVLAQVTETINELHKEVQTYLNNTEKKIRKRLRKYDGMNFDTERKGVMRGVIPKDEYSGDFKKRHRIDED